MTAKRSVSLLLLLALAPCLKAQQIQINKDNKTIAISTSDEASALADTAIVTVGFQIYGKDQQTTYDQASQTSNAIVSALTVAGVPKEAIESTGQALSPLGPDNDESKARYAQGIRFEFSQGWRVTVPASQAARVLQVAIPSGANNSGNIDWQLKHDDTLQADAAGKALQHAREIAESMAKGLGVKLGSLVYASNQTPPRGILAALNFLGDTVQLQTESASVAATVRKTAPLALSPERIRRSATVYAVFAIE